MDGDDEAGLALMDMVVAAGASATFVRDPGDPFEVTNIEIPAELGPSFIVTSLTVNRMQYLMDSVTAELFAPGHMPSMTPYVCRPGLTIELRVKNISSEPRTFRGKILGRYLPYEH